MTQNGLIYLKAADIKPRTQQIHYVYNIYAILYRGVTSAKNLRRGLEQ